jgi:hypothetical protein
MSPVINVHKGQFYRDRKEIKTRHSSTCLYLPIFGRYRQENCKFEASLGYKVGFLFIRKEKEKKRKISGC